MLLSLEVIGDDRSMSISVPFPISRAAVWAGPWIRAAALTTFTGDVEATAVCSIVLPESFAVGCIDIDDDDDDDDDKNRVDGIRIRCLLLFCVLFDPETNSPFVLLLLLLILLLLLLLLL